MPLPWDRSDAMFPRISGASPNGLPSSYRMHRVSLFNLVNRQHVLLIVHFAHFRLNSISSANVTANLRGLIDMQPHFLPIEPLDDIVVAFNAQHFTLDGFDDPHCFFITLQEIG